MFYTKKYVEDKNVQCFIWKFILQLKYWNILYKKIFFG